MKIINAITLPITVLVMALLVALFGLPGGSTKTLAYICVT